jgi:RNA polymerase sigma factor (TIGR02999 family)
MICPLMSYGGLESRDRDDRTMTRVAQSPEPKVILEPETLTDLMPSVYEELRLLAADYLRGERPGHTLQPTALVHEAYLRLLRQGQITWHNRAHILGFGARIMRQILISHAIASTRLKRGGPDSIRITLDEALDFYDHREMSVSAVDEALRSLEEIDPRQGQIVEMRFFGGLTIEEIAKALNVSTATVKREWTFGKVWLRRELSR